ncbi:MAG: CoA pyrophosphatase [Thaumarchaeota archaeon]|nr:CoA pyrophosphatase [Nitrososphaerota archaeon]
MLDTKELDKILSCPITTKVIATGRLAAVMIILFGKQPSVLMTERPKTMNHHAGEIAFPGGTWEKDDGDLLDTAIRETREELGIAVKRSMVIGNLKPVTTLNSGFTILPYITILDVLPKITPNSEIASLLEIPLVPLLHTIEDDKDPAHKSIMEMYTFKFENHLIWGASARMLKQMHDKIL